MLCLLAPCWSPGHKSKVKAATLGGCCPSCTAGGHIKCCPPTFTFSQLEILSTGQPLLLTLRVHGHGHVCTLPHFMFTTLKGTSAYKYAYALKVLTTSSLLIFCSQNIQRIPLGAFRSHMCAKACLNLGTNFDSGYVCQVIHKYSSFVRYLNRRRSRICTQLRRTQQPVKHHMDSSSVHQTHSVNTGAFDGMQ